MVDNQQIESHNDRLDSFRRDFDGKLDKLDTKIENKVSNHVFYWVAGILITIVLAIFSITFLQINRFSDKIEITNKRVDDANERLTIIETKAGIETRSSQRRKKQD